MSKASTDEKKRSMTFISGTASFHLCHDVTSSSTFSILHVGSQCSTDRNRTKMGTNFCQDVAEDFQSPFRQILSRNRCTESRCLHGHLVARTQMRAFPCKDF